MIRWGGRINDNPAIDNCGEPRACRMQDDVTPGAARGEDRAKQDDAKSLDYGTSRKPIRMGNVGWSLSD